MQKKRLISVFIALLFLSSCFGDKFTCESEYVLVNELLQKVYEDNFYSEQKKGEFRTGDWLVDMALAHESRFKSTKIEQTAISINNIKTEHASKDSGKKICKANFYANSKVFTKHGKETPFEFDYSLERGGNFTYTLEQGTEKNKVVVNLFISSFEAPKLIREPSAKLSK